MARDEIAYLGSDTVYEGKLTFKGTVRIEGRFTGDIISDGVLNIGKDAQVQGNLGVGELLLAGHFKGEALVKRRTVIYSSGVYEGNLQTPKLLTEEGAILECQITMRDPAKSGPKSGQQAIES